MLTRNDAQLAFLDTPGMHNARDLLNRELVANATAVLSDADVILLVLEPGRQDRAQEVSLELVGQARRPVVIAVNKIGRRAAQRRAKPLGHGRQGHAPGRAGLDFGP